MDKDVVVDGGLEGSDIEGGVVNNVTVEQDEAEEVFIYKFFLGVPKLLVVLVNDCVLVRVVVGGSGTVSRSDHCVRSRSGISGFGDLRQDYEDGFQRGVVPKEEIGHVRHHVMDGMMSEDYTSRM